MRSRCLRCFFHHQVDATQWVGLGFGGWGRIGDVNGPSTLHMLLERTHHEDKILAALGALCKRRNCKSASKKKRKTKKHLALGVGNWNAQTQCKHHKISWKYCKNHIILIWKPKKHLFQGFTKWRQCHAKNALNPRGRRYLQGRNFLSQLGTSLHHDWDHSVQARGGDQSQTFQKNLPLWQLATLNNELIWLISSWFILYVILYVIIISQLHIPHFACS